MLEKKPGVIKVTKLRAILWLKANFNSVNKILLNIRLIPLMKQVYVIPKEIIGSRRVKSAIQLAVNKKLISNITNQWKKPFIIISADASNYFDCIAHPITSIVYQHFGLPLPYLLSMFKTI